MTQAKIVSGKLVDGNGAPLQLRGFNYSALEFVSIDNAQAPPGGQPYDNWGGQMLYLPGSTSPTNPNGLPDLSPAAKWTGANAWRLPLNEQCYLGQTCYIPNPVAGGAPLPMLADAQGNYRATVKRFVDAATTNGWYIILDLHKNAPKAILPGNATAVQILSESATQQNMADMDNSLTFWAQVAADFAGYPNVLFDLFNEPTLTGNVVQPPNPPLYSMTAQYARGQAITTSLGAIYVCHVPTTGLTENQMATGGNWENFDPGRYAEWNAWANGGTTNIIYGDNEAITGQSFQTPSMQQLLNAVRGTGATNVCMVAGPSWAQDMSSYLLFAPVDPLKQMACSYHGYPASPGASTPGFPNDLTWCQQIISAGIPVICGETGDTTAGPFNWWTTFLPWADANGVSVLAWQWNPWGSTVNQLTTDLQGTTTPLGAFYKTWLASHTGTIGMHTTLNWILPTSREDGSAFTAANYGSANIYKAGVKYASVAAPALTFADTVTAVNGDTYRVTIVDTQSPAVEGAQSTAFVATVATPLSPPAAPILSGTVA